MVYAIRKAAVWSCPSNKKIWKCTGWWPLVKKSFNGDIIGLLIHVQANLSDHDFDVFVTLAWSCWNCRNAAVHNNRLLPAAEIINNAVHLIEEFRAAKEVCSLSPVNTERRASSWPPPALGITAINTDAAFSLDGLRGGLGGVFRSSAGVVLGAFIAPCSGALSPLIAEALAIKRALQEALRLGLHSVQVQTDCASIPKMLQQPAPATDVGLVLCDIKTLSSQFTSFSMLFVPRTCNYVAHNLAKFSLRFDVYTFWVDSVPPPLMEDIMADMP